MDEKFLQDAGLTAIESKVYLTILDLGAALAGVIARKSGIHRRSVYDAIDRLIEKGLVSYIVKNNRRHYEATNPNRLLEIVREKQDKISQLLPKLQEKYQTSKKKKQTLFFHGRDGLKAVFQDHLEADAKEILVIAASDFRDVVSEFFFKKYDAERKKKKIKQKIIYNSKKTRANRGLAGPSRTSSAREKKIAKIPLCEIRYLRQEYDSPLSMAIYSDRVAMVLWARTPYAILIKDKEIADSYRAYFDILWKSARS